MIEVIRNLFVGDDGDYNLIQHESNWAIVHACKEPHHRNALGYSGRGAPKEHPEYLVAKRGERLILNLVDAADPAYIPKEIIDAALSFIEEKLHDDKRLLVHCNQGMSRSAGIALLFLARKKLIDSSSFMAAEQEFKQLYPPCNLARGVSGFLSQHWQLYMA